MLTPAFSLHSLFPGHPRKLNKQPFSSDNAPRAQLLRSPKIHNTRKRVFPVLLASFFFVFSFFAASSCLVSSFTQHSESWPCIFYALGFSWTHAKVSNLPKGRGPRFQPMSLWETGHAQTMVSPHFETPAPQHCTQPPPLPSRVPEL